MEYMVWEGRNKYKGNVILLWNKFRLVFFSFIPLHSIVCECVCVYICISLFGVKHIYDQGYSV